MALTVPNSGLKEWVRELVDECLVSRETRRDQMKMWTSYYYNGSVDEGQAAYNRVFSHIDRLASFLYSPTETRYILEGDAAEGPDVHDLLQAGNRRFNREISRSNTDVAFYDALVWSLVKGSAFVKQIWGDEEMLEPHVVQPERMGVLREDITELDRQEAFVETCWLTKSAFKRTLPEDMDPRERNKIMERLDSMQRPAGDQDPLAEDYLLNMVVGGIAPVTIGPNQGRATVQWSAVPIPNLAPTVAKRLIRVDELWVKDRKRRDWTTFRLVGLEMLVEGNIRKRNVSDVEGEQPYTKICPNETQGYFWGQSEVAQIYRLQDRLNAQINILQEVTGLKADPPKAFVGFTGITEEKYNAMRTPGGYIYEENPNAKIQAIPPDVPPELLIEAIKETINYFDDVAGFTPVLLGQGEPGVRSQAQAQTLARNSSPRMRNRALRVERQCVELGEYAFKLLAAKDATLYSTEQKQRMILKNLFDWDFEITVDSHSSSPAFSEDARQLALTLRKIGAIDDEATLMLTHPPHEDLLILRARAKAKAQAEFMAKHPEMAMGRKPGRPKGS